LTGRQREGKTPSVLLVRGTHALIKRKRGGKINEFVERKHLTPKKTALFSSKRSDVPSVTVKEVRLRGTHETLRAGSNEFRGVALERGQKPIRRPEGRNRSRRHKAANTFERATKRGHAGPDPGTGQEGIARAYQT